MAKSFTHESLPGRVVFGPGSLRRLPREIERLGSERVMIIVGGRTKVAKETSLSLADRYAGAFTSVKPHVPFGVVGAAKETARRLHADCLLAIGGGSAVGTAKAVALEVPLPIVAVPTTYAGSEMTPIYGVTDALGKRTGRNVSVLPKVVIYDPHLTLSLPPSVTGPSAMNAMAHCVEALWAPGSNPITSLIAEEGIRALARAMPVAVRGPGDLEGRSDTLYGAYLAGAAFAVAGSGIHHKICHVLGGAYDLPHAETHAVVLPHAVAFNEPAIPEIMDRVARALDRVSDTKGTATGLYDLVEEIGAPRALKDIGMNRADLDEAVGLVLEAAPEDNPRPVHEAGIRAVLEGAYEGRRPGSPWGRVPSPRRERKAASSNDSPAREDQEYEICET